MVICFFFAAKHAGRKGECPYCGEHFIIPESEVELKPVASFMEVSQSSQTIQENPKGYVYMMTTPEEYRNFAWRRWTARLIDFWLGLMLAMALFCGLEFLSGITQIGLGFGLGLLPLSIRFWILYWLLLLLRESLPAQVLTLYWACFGQQEVRVDYS